MNPIWILINCNTLGEAKEIGEKVLQKRLASCFDIFKREESAYFWPPKSSKIQSTKGALLILDTFEEKFPEVHSFAKEIHSDDLPFIGFFEIKGTEKSYTDWMEGEIGK